ncbi:MAG: hypothetical protein ABSC36_03800 [Gaiellaceae bacterium]|jgi:hypothetical protein
MRRNRPTQLALLTALIVAIGAAAFSSPASGAPTITGQNVNRTAKALVLSGLVRAEIVTLSAGRVNDYRIYRGVVQNMRGRMVTLAERDGSTTQVRLSPVTQIAIDGRRRPATRVRRGMRATVMRNGSADASWLYLANRSPDESGATIRSLLSTGFVRAEVVSQSGGELLDRRVDTGVIESVDSASLALYESDGTTVQLQIDGSTQVQINNQAADVTELAVGMRTTTVCSGEGTIGQIWALGRKPGGRRK